MNKCLITIYNEFNKAFIFLNNKSFMKIKNVLKIIFKPMDKKYKKFVQIIKGLYPSLNNEDMFWK